MNRLSIIKEIFPGKISTIRVIFAKIIPTTAPNKNLLRIITQIYQMTNSRQNYLPPHKYIKILKMVDFIIYPNFVNEEFN